MNRKYQLGLFLFTILLLVNCESKLDEPKVVESSGYGLAILGIAQDAGYPQAGCLKDCCQPHLQGKEPSRSATCIAVVNFETQEKWLFEATPDIKNQLYKLHELTGGGDILPKGIFLTHAHMGHYTGLMHFGHEVMGTDSLPVYTMPKMANYLTNNGPWSQLVNYKNIALQPLNDDSTIIINKGLTITPFLVPHRDEYSETVGYRIQIKEKSILFIPDINKWNIWKRNILEEIKKSDLVLLDATFYKNGELPNRDMSQIPHPFVEESMNLFKDLNEENKSKVMFIHFNHTNPLLRATKEAEEVKAAGFQLAREGMLIRISNIE